MNPAIPDGFVMLAALAGGLLVLAAREAILATPAVARWIQDAVEPLRRVGREGYEPTGLERRRLAALGAVAMVVAGLVLGGPRLAALLACVGPALAGVTVARRRARYRRGVEEGISEIATAVADALAGGRSARGALAVASASLRGPAAVEMTRLRADLELGAPTAAALRRFAGRVRSPRVDALVAALLSQQLSGGDLTALLRRTADAAAERRRAVADARSATAQARFTGLLVVAMPSGGALFAELIEPGFLAGLAAEPAAVVLLGLAMALQLAGFCAIRRLGRIA